MHNADPAKPLIPGLNINEHYAEWSQDAIRILQRTMFSTLPYQSLRASSTLSESLQETLLAALKQAPVQSSMEASDIYPE